MDERQARMNNEQVISKFAAKTASATLTLDENRVEVDSTAGAMTITLPPVAEAKGLEFAIILVTDGGDLTIQDQDDSYNWSDLTCDDALDGFLLKSDGKTWWQLAAITA